MGLADGPPTLDLNVRWIITEFVSQPECHQIEGLCSAFINEAIIFLDRCDIYLETFMNLNVFEYGVQFEQLLHEPRALIWLCLRCV